jgi:hypothetical protein
MNDVKVLPRDSITIGDTVYKIGDTVVHNKFWVSSDGLWEGYLDISRSLLLSVGEKRVKTSVRSMKVEEFVKLNR